MATSRSPEPRSIRPEELSPPAQQAFAAYIKAVDLRTRSVSIGYRRATPSGDFVHDPETSDAPGAVEAGVLEAARRVLELVCADVEAPPGAPRVERALLTVRRPGGLLRRGEQAPTGDLILAFAAD